MSWSLLIGWSWANQGISLVYVIHLGAYELIELDIYAFVAGYGMIEWIYGLWKYSNKSSSSLVQFEEE